MKRKKPIAIKGPVIKKPIIENFDEVSCYRDAKRAIQTIEYLVKTGNFKYFKIAARKKRFSDEPMMVQNIECKIEDVKL